MGAPLGSQSAPEHFELVHLYPALWLLQLSSLPRTLVIAIAIVEAGMVAIGIVSRPTPPPAPAAEQQATMTATAEQGTGTR